jgi:type II secretory pathway component PulF
MPTFAYSARTRSGERLDGTLDAPDRRGVLSALTRQGYVPISIAERGAPPAPAKPAAAAKPAAPAPRPAPPPKPAAAAPARPAKSAPGRAESGSPPRRWKLERKGPPRMKIRQALDFFRDVNDLLRSGMPLGTALKKLSQREGGDERNRVIAALHEDIVQGANLSNALAKHPESFPALCLSLVRAGEATGQLSEALQHIINHYERSLEARDKIVMTLTYPMIVLFFGLGTLVFSMVFVVPKFMEVFGDLGQTLPGPTRLLIGISDFIGGSGGLVTAVGLAVSFILFLRWRKTPAGERAWDSFLLRMPVVRRILSASAFGRFARTLGGLLKNGVPVLKSMEIVEETVGNRLIAEEIAAARSRVKDGASLSRPLAQGRIFPTLLTDMLAVGEEAGDMPGALEHIAERYDEDLNRSLKLFTTVLEPLILLFVALLVGFVVVAMILPVFSMSQGIDI